MYLEHFGLLEQPFSIAPDPRYLYMSERHREALAHLLYGLESDGAFILLTGDVGTGKTTVSRCLLEQVPENINLAMVLNPKLNAIELLQVISDELHIEYSDLSVKSLVDGINHYLLDTHSQGKKTVVLIEEAQNLDLDVLEQLRLLTNLETNDSKLLQVILLGQPEFLDVLDRPELSQLSQRITARYHLKPLGFKELEEYVGHRLAVAGCRRPLFALGVLKSLYGYSGGVPRLVNVICDRALLGAYVQGKHYIDKKTLSQAAKEVLGENKTDFIHGKKKIPKTIYIVASILLMCLLAGAYYLDGLKQEIDLFIPEPETVSQLTGEQQLEIAQPVVEKKLPEVQSKQPVHNEKFVWPEHNVSLRSNALAYRSLFKSWNVDYQSNVDSTPCFFAKTQRLSCYQGKGGIDLLRQLNRPAVIKLYDDFKQPQYATLLELEPNKVKIFMGDTLQTVSLEQLMFYWQGEFSLLWHMPPNYEEAIKPWTTSKAVFWLNETMNKIDGIAQAKKSNVYDRALLERVKQFQAGQGLESDGVVGAKTIIRLHQIVGLEAPVLEAVN